MMVKNKQMFGITIDDLINLDPGDKKITAGKVSRLTLTESAFKRAHAAHIPLPFGSGRSSATEGQMAIGGEAVQFTWMTKWGMTTTEALQTAFMVAADSLNYNWGSQIGSLEKGKFADVIAVSGNPLTDITEMERVKFVMKGGEVFRNDIAGRAAGPSTAGR
jgi:imidazolonepropionase-like amidohydrolase